MGITTWVTKFLRERYRSDDPTKNAFPVEDPGFGTMLVVDLMQHLKHKPDSCITRRHLLQYIMNHVRRRINAYNGRLKIIVLCVDQKVTEHKCNAVKSICHEKRYKNVDFYPEDEGPYIPTHPDGQLPPEWNRFCGNSNLLRRELFPLLYNACLGAEYFQLQFGQTLILQGFPGLTFDRIPGMKPTHLRYLTTGINDPNSADALQGVMQNLVPWNAEWLPISKGAEEDDPDMYNRVYIIEAVSPGVDNRFPKGFLRTDEWKEARNNLGEADLAMMFFDRFFPDVDQIIDINDGDIYPISLLYAPERLVGNTWRNKQLLALPIKKGNKKRKKTPLVEEVAIVEAPQIKNKKEPTHIYCDVNMLYSRICDDPLFGNHGVQNHVVMLVFMIILSGTDFFKDSFGGIGVEKNIWKTLTGKFNVFHHLVQCTKNIIPDPYALRTVVIDERAWRQFAYWCYAEKHGNAARKKQKTKTLTFKTLKIHLSGRKNPQHRMPDRNSIRRWGRQILWNMEYWLNGPRYVQNAANFPDPFLLINGESFYGYEIDDETGKLRFAEHVAITQREADEVYTQHFMAPPTSRVKKKRKSTLPEGPTNDDLMELEKTAAELFHK